MGAKMFAQLDGRGYWTNNPIARHLMIEMMGKDFVDALIGCGGGEPSKRDGISRLSVDGEYPMYVWIFVELTPGQMSLWMKL